MRTNSRSRGRGLVLAVLSPGREPAGAGAGAAERTISHWRRSSRQRVPCDQEDPIYKIYKHQYFGYHPTCWRTLPDGWGCPSPEAPDKEKSFKETPAGTPGDTREEPDRPAADEGAMPGQPAPDQTQRAGAAADGTRSPFDEPTSQAPLRQRPRGRQHRSPGDPFELDKPDKPPAARRPRAAGRCRRPRRPAATARSSPRRAEDAGPIQGSRTSRNERTTSRMPDEDGPLLALPNVNLPPVDDPGVPFGTQPPAAAATPRESTTPRLLRAAPRFPERPVQQPGSELDAPLTH